MAKKTCNLIVNGRSIKAHPGETLLDAALGGWTVIPHDCCSGQCESCRVTVLSGMIDDQGTRDGRTVLACQATVDGDAKIEFEDLPLASRRAGMLTELAPLSTDVVEVVVRLAKPLDLRPGQYVSVKFSGFPARDLSPTVRPDGRHDPCELVFHIRRYPGGLVSTRINTAIRVGHRVQVRGPFGQAFLRSGDGPIVLVAGGTGWAPIWSLASAARRSQRHRKLTVIAGARDPDGIYMRRSLEVLAQDGVSDVIATTQVGTIDPFRTGVPTDYLPDLRGDDTVYVAGPPGLVDAVKSKARAAQAPCYADPFLPGTQRLSLGDRLMQMFRRSAGEPTVGTPRNAQEGFGGAG
jgi:3-phenylpropionate/trans-cinnamate dioxygenase ferredoxin reductase subunit